MAEIHRAAKSGDISRLKQIITSDPSQLEAHNWWNRDTPLLSAMRANKPDAARFLIEQGANVNAMGRKGSTALHLLYWGPVDNPLIDVLLQHGGDINSRDRAKRTPLHMVALMGSDSLTERLIEAGADVNARMRDGATPLHYAALRGFASVVKTLLSRGADPLLCGTYGTSYSFRNVTPAVMAENMNVGPSNSAGYKRTIILLKNAERQAWASRRTTPDS